LPEHLDLAGALNVRQSGREVEILANGNSERLIEKLRAARPEDLVVSSLSLEELFVASNTLTGSNP
jgi:acylphosphatase